MKFTSMIYMNIHSIDCYSGNIQSSMSNFLKIEESMNDQQSPHHKTKHSEKIDVK